MNEFVDIVQGDSRFPLEIQLWERACDVDCEDDRPVNLDETYRVYLHIYLKGVLHESYQLEANGDARNGLVLNDFWGDTWSEKGVYRADVQIDYLDGGSKTMENQIIFKVRAKGGK